MALYTLSLNPDKEKKIPKTGNRANGLNGQRRRDNGDAKRYCLLILDGHSSHANANFDHFCMERWIIPLYMSPHSSHLLQPLDISCFAPFKHYYGQKIRERV